MEEQPRPIHIEGGVALRKCDVLDDWYTVERAHHDGNSWVEHVRDPEGFTYDALRYSGRISDADVEGTAADMRGIADAIEKRAAYRAKRCSVRVGGGHAYFCSPRNSQRDAQVSLGAADALAREIRGRLGGAE